MCEFPLSTVRTLDRPPRNRILARFCAFFERLSRRLSVPQSSVPSGLLVYFQLFTFYFLLSSIRAVTSNCPTCRWTCSAAWKSNPITVDGNCLRPTPRASVNVVAASHAADSTRDPRERQHTEQIIDSAAGFRLKPFAVKCPLLLLRQRFAARVREQPVDHAGDVLKVKADRGESVRPMPEHLRRKILQKILASSLACNNACAMGCRTSGTPSTGPRSHASGDMKIMNHRESLTYHGHFARGRAFNSGAYLAETFPMSGTPPFKEPSPSPSAEAKSSGTA